MCCPTPHQQHGALVISLDFELHWGVRDWGPVDGPYRLNLLGARSAAPRILALFAESRVAATWATVGFLFARDRGELTDFFPIERPRYRQPRFDPYGERIGRNENDDPLHFARSLLERIRQTPRQEIGSHTFSHYFCLEDGQDVGSFRADLTSAQRIASATMGLTLRSLVLPRNQFNPEYSAAIREAGFLCYRGNQRGRIYQAAGRDADSAGRRALRLSDTYIPVLRDRLQSWHEVPTAAGLGDVRASRFLRPCSPLFKALDPWRAGRILTGMRAAARNAQIYHLWWHPHNFGAHIDESIQFLSRILTEFRDLRNEFGFQSMSMAEAAGQAASLESPAAVEVGQI